MGKFVVYMAHPVAADTADGVRANLARAKRWLWALRRTTEWSICAPWIPMVEAALDLGVPEADERVRGIGDCVAVVERCDAIVLCGGRVSGGMEAERQYASIAFNLTSLGDEPPSVEEIRAALAGD